jgi:hypothetical protein
MECITPSLQYSNKYKVFIIKGLNKIDIYSFHKDYFARYLRYITFEIMVGINEMPQLMSKILYAPPSSLRSLAPSGLPHPVHASQPGRAV